MWGYTPVWTSAEDQVQVSDPERTILDGLARPDLCAGVSEVATGLLIRKDDLDWKKLAEYAQRLGSQAVVYFPAGILLLLTAAFGLGTFLAALNVKYRDFRYTMPFLLHVLFFASQLIYPLQSIQQTWLKYLLAVNPMNAAIEQFRMPLTHGEFNATILLIGLTSSLLLFIAGLFCFRKTESYFADLA